MKMRVRKKINWMKRMVAAGMAVCMVLMTPASALAGAGEGTETQTISEEAAGESILDTGTGSVDAGEDGGTGGQTESTEQSGTKTRTDSAEPSEKDSETCGGFVGHMAADSQLTIAGTSAAQVSSTSGNAGGLVGSVTDGKISVQAEKGENEADAGKFAFADTLTLKAGSEKAAGGLIGAYSVTKGGTNDGTGNSISYDLSEYEFHSITVSGGKNVGGLFGVLKNTSTSSTTVAVSGKMTDAITTKVPSESEVTNLAG